MSGVVRYVRNVILGTFCVEGAGALILFFRFLPEFGFGKALWYGVFHSISAFCNAGFDILGRADTLYPSLTAYISDPLVNIVIMLLIIVGGIGFLTWDDVCTHRLHLRRYRMQSKVIRNCHPDRASGIALLPDRLCRASRRTARSGVALSGGHAANGGL